MIKAVIFDMYETLATLYTSDAYMGKQIAEDMQLSEHTFREIWDPSEADRTLGKRTFEDVIAEVLKTHHRYTPALFEQIISRRKTAASQCFQHLHPEILPMLAALKRANIQVGLITNCYFEEKRAIENSVLYGFFDTACMSCDQGMKKPDVRIFQTCLEQLSVLPTECLYVGDGGSEELETARMLGMHPLQATWYLKEGVNQPTGRMPDFSQADCPMAVWQAVGCLNGLSLDTDG
jgi:putative hydrolase of the HAD superfamily